MEDRAVGAFIILGSIGLLLIVAAIQYPVLGMAASAAVLGLCGLGLFVSAKTVMHEIEGILLIIGAVMCAGIGGLARQMAPTGDAARNQSATPNRRAGRQDPPMRS